MQNTLIHHYIPMISIIIVIICALVIAVKYFLDTLKQRRNLHLIKQANNSLISSQDLNVAYRESSQLGIYDDFHRLILTVQNSAVPSRLTYGHVHAIWEMHINNVDLSTVTDLRQFDLKKLKKSFHGY